jgi:hypothetical protein
MLEVGIVACDRQSRPVLGQRGDERTLSVMGFREAFDRREILRRAFQNVLEFVLRVLELVELEQRPSKRHTRRVISGVNREAGAGGVYRFLQLSRAAVLFGELRERDGRRILLDPSSKIVNAL